MSRAHLGGWALVLVLALVPVGLEQRAARAPHALRAPSPLRELAADWSWIRFQHARLAHDDAHALRHARTAVALAPERTAGWQRLCAHLGYELAAAQREPELGLRRAWLEAAVACALEGEARASEPRALRLDLALLCWSKALHDPGLGDPRGDVEAGARALLERAAESFALAGEPELARHARAAAQPAPAR